MLRFLGLHRGGSPSGSSGGSPRASRVQYYSLRKERRIRIPESPLVRQRTVHDRHSLSPMSAQTQAQSNARDGHSDPDPDDDEPTLFDLVVANKSRAALIFLSSLDVVDRRRAILQVDAKKNTALHAACSSGASECAAVILGSAAATSVDGSEMLYLHNGDGLAPIHCAAAAGHVRCMLLVARAMSAFTPPVPHILKVESDGESLSSCFTPCADHARAPTSTADFRTVSGASALDIAAGAGHSACVEALVGAFGSVSGGMSCMRCRGGLKRETPLHCAARAGSVACVAALLSAGACVADVDAMGRTPALVALRHESIECVEYLLCADTSASPDSPYLALPVSTLSKSGLCAECGSVGCCAWLHERAGALTMDVDAANRMRALFHAHDTGHVECAEYILSRADATDKRLLACAWLLKSKGVPVGDLKFTAQRVHGRRRASTRTRVDVESQGNSIRDALAFSAIMGASWEQLAGGVTVQFDAEAGKGPGVNREWMRVAWEELADESVGLLVSHDSGHTHHPRRCSLNADGEAREDVRVGGEQMCRERAFRLMGRLVGLSFLHEIQLPLHLSRPLLRFLAGIDAANPADMAGFDPDFASSVVDYVTANEVGSLGLTFTDVETIALGDRTVHREFELCEGGFSMDVTDANKDQYLRLLCHARVVRGLERELSSFREGLHDVVPLSQRPFVSVFAVGNGPAEFDVILSGLSHIDFEDWRDNTGFGEGYTSESPQVQWLWEVIRSMDGKAKAALLRFVTGSPSVPFGGFGSLRGLQGPQPFEIHRANGNDATLPSAATCFNRLFLPAYSSAAILAAKLTKAVEYGGAGFVFV